MNRPNFFAATWLAAGLLAGLAAAPGAAAEPNAGQNAEQSAGQEGDAERIVVLADVAHAASAEQRTVLDRGPTGFSRLADALKRHGAALRVGREPLAPAVPAGVDVVLVTAPSPDGPFSKDELAALEEFVRRGRVLLLTTNDLSREGLDAWVPLARRFGIQSHGSVLNLVGSGQKGRAHVSRYSGAGLVRWLPEVEDAWLYYRGTSAGPVDGEVLLHYNGNALAARRRIGRGWVYAFGGGDLIGNAFAPPPEDDAGTDAGADANAPAEPRPVNDRLIDAVAAELVQLANSNLERTEE
jgi:hypothetical protein